jgi:hypothetical protein
MTIKQISITDIQFDDKYDVRKARHLVEEMRVVERSLNSVIRAWNALENSSSNGSVKHEIANSQHIGDAHSVSGLTAGSVLKVIAPDDVAFQPLTLDDLFDVSIQFPEDGQVLQFNGVRWVSNHLLGIASLTNPGQDAILWWNNFESALDWLLPSTSISISSGYIQVIPSGITHGNLSGLNNDDHPQYTRRIQNEIITGAWVFKDAVTIESVFPHLRFINDNAAINETNWDFFINGPEWFWRTLDSVDTPVDNVMSIRRIGASVDSMGILDAISIERSSTAFTQTMTYGNDGLQSHLFRGSLYLPDDDQGLVIGAAGQFSFRHDGDDAYVQNAEGRLYLDAIGGLTAWVDDVVLYSSSVLFGNLDLSNDDGLWGIEISTAMLQLLSRQDDGTGGEAWLTVLRDAEVVSQINLQGDSFTFNGFRVISEGAGSQISFTPISADPSSPQDGDAWYNSTAGKFRGRANGVTVDFH